MKWNNRFARRYRTVIDRNYKDSKSYVPREKLYNCTWIFTIGDCDDHPSVLHAHSLENGYRLNAWTGEIYPPGNVRDNVIGKLNKKELRILHSDSNFIKFAKKQIYWYHQ